MSIIVGVLITVFSIAGMSKPKVIYGEDNRLDVYQVRNHSLLYLTQGTAAVIPKNVISVDRTGLMKITSESFAESFGMCETERFASQPNPANCSAFLVGDDLVATAGHCISAGDCGSYSFVFGYHMMGPDKAPEMVPAYNVYNCKEVIKREYTGQQDYALIRLDRKAKGRIPLVVRRKGKPQVGDNLVVVGHPSGLPTKIAGGAKLRSISEDGSFFTASLDTYGGNSGSAVFNTRTLEIEGILVRGETDYRFDFNNSCRISNVCEMDGCRGEDVTSIHYITDLLTSM